jgi:hypothetical protein
VVKGITEKIQVDLYDMFPMLELQEENFLVDNYCIRYISVLDHNLSEEEYINIDLPLYKEDFGDDGYFLTLVRKVPRINLWKAISKVALGFCLCTYLNFVKSFYKNYFWHCCKFLLGSILHILEGFSKQVSYE